MTQEESKNLQKYFEDEPASFFDDLAPKEGEFQKKFVENLDFYRTFFQIHKKSLQKSEIYGRILEKVCLQFLWCRLNHL